MRPSPWKHLTPWLAGAGARSAEGTDIGHENAEGMAYVGVRVEPPVRLGSGGTGVRYFELMRWVHAELAPSIERTAKHHGEGCITPEVIEATLLLRHSDHHS